MRKRHLPFASAIIVFAVLDLACSRGVLRTGAEGTSAAPPIPSPVHQTAAGTCDTGADACSAQGPSQEGTCDPGLTACPGSGAGYCFDLQASPEHCGACGQACALGSPCEKGQCQVVHCTSQMSSRTVPTTIAGKLPITPIDCDRDGNLDLLGFGSVFRGNGDGTFVQGDSDRIATAYWQGHAITVADLNRDQIPDLIIKIPLADVTTKGQPLKVVVRLGKGDCTFGPEVGTDVGPDVISMTIGDLDGDQILDLAVSASERISTFHGNEDGSFSNRKDFVVGGAPWQMVVTDWNSDGIPDLVASDDNLHLLFGTGGGHFAPAAVDCALTTISPVIADFDGDGVLDIASDNAVLFGMHECNFTRQIVYAPPYHDSFADCFPLAAGDFNGDGTIDLVFSSGYGIGFVAGDGHGNFGAVVLLRGLDPDHTPEGNVGAYAGDFNGDGRLDLILTGTMQAKTLINTCQ